MSDPYFSDVSLLLHMDGSDGSTTFTDSSSNTLTVTANGNAQIDTAQSKFGGASALFDGSGDYLSIPDAPEIRLGSSDFTIECWVRFSSLSGRRTFAGKWAGNIYTGREWFWRVDPGSNELEFLFEDAATNTFRTVPHTWTPATGEWYFISIVRSGNDFYHFVDGVSLGSPVTLNYEIHSEDGLLLIGAQNNGTKTGIAPVNEMDGWIDDFRITKGVSRYTSNFTPPTAAFPDSAGAGPTEEPVGFVTESETVFSVPDYPPTIAAAGLATETESVYSVTQRDVVPLVQESESVFEAGADFSPKFDVVMVSRRSGQYV